MSIEHRILDPVEFSRKLGQLRTMSNVRLLEERWVGAQWAYLGGCEMTRAVGCRHLDATEVVLTERGLV